MTSRSQLAVILSLILLGLVSPCPAWSSEAFQWAMREFWPLRKREELLHLSRQYEQAIRVGEQALKVAPQCPTGENTTWTPDGLRRLALYMISSDYEDWANELTYQGKYQEAVDKYQLAINNLPNPDVHNLLDDIRQGMARCKAKINQATSQQGANAPSSSQEGSTPPPGQVVITPGHYVTAYEMGSSTPHQIWVPPVYGPAPNAQAAQATPSPNPFEMRAPGTYKPSSTWMSSSPTPTASPSPAVTANIATITAPILSTALSSGSGAATSTRSAAVTPAAPDQVFNPDFSIVNWRFTKDKQVLIAVTNNTNRPIVARILIKYNIGGGAAPDEHPSITLAPNQQGTMQPDQPGNIHVNLTQFNDSAISGVQVLQDLPQ